MQNLTKSIAVLLSSYSQAINKQQARKGALFRPKTKAKTEWIDGFVTLGSKREQLLFRPENDYARQCFQYIHLNPVKAGLVQYAEEWPYSSAVEYCGDLTRGLCNKKLAQKLLSLGANRT